MPDEPEFAPPPFKPDEALERLKRDLRALRVFSERGAAFEWKGRAAVELGLETVDGSAALKLRLAKRPAVSPEWEPRRLKSNTEVRSALDEIKRRVARWSEE